MNTNTTDSKESAKKSPKPEKQIPIERLTVRSSEMFRPAANRTYRPIPAE